MKSASRNYTKCSDPRGGGGGVGVLRSISDGDTFFLGYVLGRWTFSGPGSSLKDFFWV